MQAHAAVEFGTRLELFLSSLLLKVEDVDILVGH